MNLVNLFLNTSRDRAIIDGSDSYTHEELRNLSLRIASGLVDEGNIVSGARVAIIAHNSVEFLIAYLAVLSCGGIAIPLDPHAGESERAHDIAVVRPHLIITSSRDWIPEKYRDAIPYIEFHSDVWREYGKKKPLVPVERESTDVAVMMMTSGVSFQPRPAMLTHGSLAANLEQAKSVSELNLTNQDLVLAVLPMYHIFGLHVVAGLTLHAQATLVISRTFDPAELADLIGHHRVTIVPGVPLLFDAFVTSESVTIDKLTGVRLFVSGGAPMRSEVRAKFYERFGAHVAEGYGLTEASPMVSFTPNALREGDIGTPLAGVEVDIRDSSGSVALVGDVGQIVVRGENIFAGYFGERDATSRVLDQSGWLFTGDIGVRNDDDSITLIDRSNDVIVVYGFSVYPSEVESVLLECELVDQASVVGALDETSGESVVAYIDAASDLNDVSDAHVRRRVEKELREFCITKLARYKVPTRFEFIHDANVRASARPLRKSLRSALRHLE